MNNSINVLSLFDGMSCGQIALERAGFTVANYFASEVDKYAIQVTKHNYPSTQHIGDVREVGASGLPAIDFMIGGSPCFIAGTKVITQDSYKNIEDIIIGDLVLTHENRYRKVLSTGGDRKTIYVLKAQGIADTGTTAEHPYYTVTRYREWNTITKKSERKFTQPQWKQVKELSRDDFIGIPILTGGMNPRNLNLEDSWLLGRYVADGHIRKTKRKNRKNSYQYQVVYSVGNSKVQQFKDNVTRNFLVTHILNQYTDVLLIAWSF